MREKQKEPKRYWLHEQLERVQRRKGTKLRSRWYVVEIKPAYQYFSGDGHGGSDIKWTRDEEVATSEYFDKRESAVKFLQTHEPDEGNRFEIRQESLYQKVVETWYPGD